jgi:5-methylcytosine-specific restriction endonuclease McrA
VSPAARVPAALRAQVAAADDHQCAYCHTSEEITGLPLEIDHITPAAAGGTATFENLCTACGPCNRTKARLTEAIDPLTGELAPLFHPRQQRWADHFAWSAGATQIEGLTAVG